jgi:hypothetical protein
MEMNQTNPSNGMNMGGMPNTQTPSPAPKHKGHGGLIAAIVIVIVAAVAAVLLIGQESTSVNYQNNMNTTEGDTVILDEDASDDLNSIENDLESMDIESLDSGLE